MAEKKTTKKKTTTKKTTKKKETVTYKEQEYTVLDRVENRIMLTDGSIHFWVSDKDVSA